MQAEEIIESIGQTLSDGKMDREEKIQQLKMLAEECWSAVFPERGTPSYDNLETNERHARWEVVRSLVRQRDDAEQVFRVLDWPGAGGTFHWL